MQHRLKPQATLRGTVLWIDGKRTGEASIVPDLRAKGLLIDIVTTGKAALGRLADLKPHVIIVDAESMRTSGLRICQNLHEATQGQIPIILIVNPERPVGKDPSIRYSLKQPFTSRKISNRIAALLPSNGGSLLTAGAISLDLERNVVTCGEREAHLTPRLAGLLQMLMEQPGAVLHREVLFQKVWNTDYMGDTRTLDVHISWLRKAIETDPRSPRYLKTIRGVGYLLDP